MKSAAGFRVGRRLSLQRIIRIRIGHDRRQGCTGLAPETTGPRDLATDKRIFEGRRHVGEWVSGSNRALSAAIAVTTAMVGLALAWGAIR